MYFPNPSHRGPGSRESLLQLALFHPNASPSPARLPVSVKCVGAADPWLEQALNEHPLCSWVGLSLVGQRHRKPPELAIGSEVASCTRRLQGLSPSRSGPQLSPGRQCQN